MSTLHAQTPPSTPEFTVPSPLRSEITDLSSLIDIMITFLLPFALVILFLMFVYAGFTFMTAHGEQDKINKAKGVMISSITGVILLLVAFFLVRILATVFGLDGGGIISP